MVPYDQVSTLWTRGYSPISVPAQPLSHLLLCKEVLYDEDALPLELLQLCLREAGGQGALPTHPLAGTTAVLRSSQSLDCSPVVWNC